MQINELEWIKNELTKIIDREKQNSNKRFSDDQYNRTDFYKFQRIVEGSISALKRRTSYYSNITDPEVLEIKEELKKWDFVAEAIRIFIEWELQDMRDKVD